MHQAHQKVQNTEVWISENKIMTISYKRIEQN